MFLIIMIRKEISLIRYLRKGKLIWIKLRKAFKASKINLELKMSRNLKNKLNKVKFVKQIHQKV